MLETGPSISQMDTEESSLCHAQDPRNLSLTQGREERNDTADQKEYGRFCKSWAGQGAGQGHLQEVPPIPPYKNSRKENPTLAVQKNKEKKTNTTFFSSYLEPSCL